MENIVKYRDYDILIENDDDTESPREWDNLGTMVCSHRRLTLGDVTLGWKTRETRYASIYEFSLWLEKEKPIYLPLYLYEHSGITMNTIGFSCPWDSGQVGVIFVEREQILKEYNVKRISKKLRKKIEDILRLEVKAYDQYLRGEVYWYQISKDGEDLDSCGGNYGYDYALDEAKKVVDDMITMEVKNGTQDFCRTN